jgi:hypothetical protein
MDLSTKISEYRKITYTIRSHCNKAESVNLIIKTRCTNKNAPDYERYGGRGVTMCDEWLGSFDAFLNYLGPRPSKQHSVDRIDNGKGYEPGNVRWATKTEQQRNKQNSTYVTDGIRILHITDAANELGITRGAAHLRLKRGKLDGFTKN